MINIRSLKAEMARNEVTGRELAEVIGITPKTFYQKMKRGVFKSDEAQIICNYLKIEDPAEIFFNKQ